MISRSMQASDRPANEKMRSPEGTASSMGSLRAKSPMLLRMKGATGSRRRATRPGKEEMRQFHGSQYVERTGGQETSAWNSITTGSAAGTSANPMPMARVGNGALGIRKRVPV